MPDLPVKLMMNVGTPEQASGHFIPPAAGRIPSSELTVEYL